MALKRGNYRIVVLYLNLNVSKRNQLPVVFIYSSDTSPLLNSSSSERLFDTMGLEIEQLLSKVSLSCSQNCTHLVNVSSKIKQYALKGFLFIHKSYESLRIRLFNFM